MLSATDVLKDPRTLEVTGAVIAVLVLLRAAAMFTASALAGRRPRRVGSATPYGWRESAVASWAGMRGVVTVATALALPETVDGGGPFPAREEVVLVALLVVIATRPLRQRSAGVPVRLLTRSSNPVSMTAIASRSSACGRTLAS